MNLQKLPQFFPNVTNLKIYWDYDSIDDNLSFTEEMFAQLGLKKMLKFHVNSNGTNLFPDYTHSTFMDDNLEEVLPNEILESRSASWRAFVNNNCQLQVLNMSGTCIPMELLQIALESLPLLKNLRVRVDGCNYSLANYQPEYTFDEYDEIYIEQQAEKTANLIGDNYDRFEELVLKLENEGGHVVEHLQNNYPNVIIENQTKRTYDEIRCDKLLKVIILCHNSRNRYSV
jgi:hypothetical protein